MKARRHCSVCRKTGHDKRAHRAGRNPEFRMTSTGARYPLRGTSGYSRSAAHEKPAGRRHKRIYGPARHALGESWGPEGPPKSKWARKPDRTAIRSFLAKHKGDTATQRHALADRMNTDIRGARRIYGFSGKEAAIASDRLRKMK